MKAGVAASRYLEIIRTTASSILRWARTTANWAAGPRTESPISHHTRWCLTGIAVGLAWTAFGSGLAAVEGRLRGFLQEWYLLQGPFLVATGAWLLLIIRAHCFQARVKALAGHPVTSGVLGTPLLRIGIPCTIGVLGTASLIALGFNAQGRVLDFMWVTCAVVCFTAGVATLHTLEVITTLARLQTVDLKVFRHAPAKTPELRSVVNYFSSFTLLVTAGYAFALVGTLDPHWEAQREYVDAVRLLWPLVYVPLCSIALMYPHIVVHRIIQREKERTLLSCERDIDDMLLKYGTLKGEEINRTNSLAELFEHVNATPDYVVDVGVATRTVLPLAFNLASLLFSVAGGHIRP